MGGHQVAIQKMVEYRSENKEGILVSRYLTRWILGKTGNSIHILEEEDLNKCSKKEKAQEKKNRRIL